jgi:hypothetical protein
MPSTSTIARDLRRRRLTTLIWVTLLSAIVVFLLYREMIAVLYILATLGVTGLLVVVGLADLSKSDTVAATSQPMDDSAAIGSGISSVSSNKKA